MKCFRGFNGVYFFLPDKGRTRPVKRRMRCLGIAAVHAPEGACVAVFVQVFVGRALGAHWPVAAVGLSVPERLALETAHRDGDVGAHSNSAVSHHDSWWEIGGVERQDYVVSWDGAASSPYTDLPRLRNSKGPKSLSDLVVACVTQFEAADHAFPDVFGSVRGNCHRERHVLFVTAVTY